MNNRYFELRGDWFIAVDEEDLGQKEHWETKIPSFAVSAFVPSIIQQFFPEYHGLAYYWCRFSSHLCHGDGDRILLRFGGVDYKADAYLNGVLLGTEECPETPFTFDVTDTLREGENLLAVRVLNPTDRIIDGIHLQNVPHRNKVSQKRAGSSLNHGGIWYGVSLEVRPSVYLDDVFLLPDPKSGKITARITAAARSAADATVTVTVRDPARVFTRIVMASTPAFKPFKLKLPRLKFFVLISTMPRSLLISSITPSS